jgi:hypothetical protein
MEHLTPTILMLSAKAAGSLINATGEGIILAATVGLCLRFLPGIKPAARFVIWLAVLFAILPLHLLPLAKSSFAPNPPGVNTLHVDVRWSLLMVASWGVLSLTRAIRLLHSFLELRRIAIAGTPYLPSPACSTLLKSGRRRVELCTSPDVARPSVIGFFRPRILLPSDLLPRISAHELEQILLHELAHLRRRDDWTNLIQKITLIFFPLNPVLFWIERRLCIERELACDDCVLNFTLARKAYATCLTNLAEHTLLRRSVSLALGAWEKQSELARRVHRILRRPEKTMGHVAARAVMGALITGLFGGALFLARSPEFISFSPSTHTAMPAIASMATSSTPDSHARNLSPTFVKAVMPEPEREITTYRARTHHYPLPIKAVHRLSKPQQERWVLLTGWQSTSATPRPVLAVSESTASSYAAVPVGNGWLILQL